VETLVVLDFLVLVVLVVMAQHLQYLGLLLHTLAVAVALAILQELAEQGVAEQAQHLVLAHLVLLTQVGVAAEYLTIL
jgi:hypothetical protein